MSKFMNNGNPLWGTLIRTATARTPDAPSVPVPPTAMDKQATSMRVLLHDTQAALEQFSARVETLAAGMAETQREVVVVKELFNGAQEKLVMDVVDVVNRCQTHLQTAVGEPVQAAVAVQNQKDNETRFEQLTKRTDDLYMSVQSLATTMQHLLAMNATVQEHQSKILTALLPLEPLLKALPTHIDSARACINESMLKMSIESIRQTEPSRKRPSNSPSSPIGERKKARFENDTDASSPTRRALLPRPIRSPSTNAPLTSIFLPANAPRLPLADLTMRPQNNLPTTRTVASSVVPMTPPSSFSTTKLELEQPVVPASSPIKPSSPRTVVATSMTAPRSSAKILGPGPVRQRRSPFRDNRRFLAIEDDDDSGSEVGV
ncbi:hypothetical protein MKEN_00110300 [Mycena kentingensis (nom. inval.)]|nr:hypothetical protein MKEN_00110300 [Mycena kentingensis (nom. inval.)]